jgi:hypothetical protein
VQRKASYTRDILREELLEDDSGKSSLKGQAQESSASISERNSRFLIFAVLPSRSFLFLSPCKVDLLFLLFMKLFKTQNEIPGF